MFDEIIAAIDHDDPINITGPMGAGKTTLAEFIKDKCGYKLLDEVAWKRFGESVGYSVNNGADYRAVGDVLTPALNAWFAAHDAPPKTVINMWIHKLRNGITIYLDTKDPSTAESRGTNANISEHFSKMESTYKTEADIVLTRDEANSLMELIEKGDSANHEDEPVVDKVEGLVSES